MKQLRLEEALFIATAEVSRNLRERRDPSFKLMIDPTNDIDRCEV
jgi:hypothetical protein